jgi:hypothetical protein
VAAEVENSEIAARGDSEVESEVEAQGGGAQEEEVEEEELTELTEAGPACQGGEAPRPVLPAVP